MDLARRFFPLSTVLVFAGCSMTGGNAGNAPHDPSLNLAEMARGERGDPELFTSYNAGGPVRWSQQWPWKFDMTGVGWDSNTTVTAITPRHVVMAAHFIRGPGHGAVFHDRRGLPHPRTIEKVVYLKDVGLNVDIAVGLLDEPLPQAIRIYPLLAPSPNAAETLPGAPVLVTDQDRRLFIHRIATVTANNILFRFDPQGLTNRKKNLIVGDSGNPSFLLTGNQLALIETHSVGGAGAGPFYGSGGVHKAIRAAVANLDPAYRIKTVGADQKVLGQARQARDSSPAPAAARPPASQSAPGAPPPQSVRRPRPRVVVPPE